MTFGGGIFVTQNKVLPGAYINFVSAARANVNFADRGFAAMPLELDWGVDGAVMTVTNEDFIYNSQKIFGYDYTHEKMKGLRDVFKNCRTLYVYKLNGGTKASNTFAEAKYSGTRGNALRTIIKVNVDDALKFDVFTYLDLELVDTQTVSTATELVDNDFCTFKADATLAETASTTFTGGTDGTVTATQWQAALTALESYSFNTFGAVTTDEDIKKLVVAWTVRMRDEVGVKFQTVVYNYAADDKAIINAFNPLVSGESAAFVYWVTGAQCACKVNASLTNTVYDGDFDFNIGYGQSDLIDGIKAGKFMLHRVGDTARVLTDINSKVTVTEDEGEDFKSNQVMRVIDQRANDIAVLWANKYLGKIPNDDAGRVSLWNDLVTHAQDLQRLRAIENFMPEDITVMKGNDKKSVVVSESMEITNAMEKLYLTCVIA